MAVEVALASTDGRLVENIVHFTRALRKAGVKVGTAQVETAIRAVEAAGFSHRNDFYHVLRSTLITRSDQLEVYHQVFSMFWRDPDFLEAMMHLMSPRLSEEGPPPDPSAAQRRAEEALGERPEQPQPPKDRTTIVEDALLSWSGTEVDKRKDFEQMSASELAEAERMVQVLSLRIPAQATRRQRATRRGTHPDTRATLRRALRRGGEIDRVARKSPRRRPPDLVAICDISGSMSVYSRMLMRFLHAVAHATDRDWRNVSAFTFGTQLTNVTRALQIGDPDAALAAVGREATDWEGGTRIGAAIERFNKDWSRRVLGSGAVVLLITDGLERSEPELLDAQMKRLSLSCRSLIWLNPLLRWDGFSPRAAGIRAMMPHVDRFHACHSIESLADVSNALSHPSMHSDM